MGSYWAPSVRRRRRRGRITLVVFVATALLFAMARIVSEPVTTSGEMKISASMSVYTVRSGESLSSIAYKFNTSVAALAKANNIRDVNRVRAGQKLLIAPASSVKKSSTTKVVVRAAKAPAKKVTTSVSKKAAPAKPKATVPASIAILPAKASAGGSKLLRDLQQSTVRLSYKAFFDKWADANNISRDLVKSVCYMESGWNNDAVSSTGALGIGQLLPTTAEFIRTELIGKRELSPKNPEDNIRMSARYLRYLIELSGGNEQLAVAAYY